MTSHETAPALPRPGPIGRALRLLLGAGLLWLFANLLADLPALADGVDLTNPLTWLGLGYALYALPEIVGLVLSRRWPAPLVRGVAAAGLLLAALVDLALSGSPNGGAFGLALGLLLAGVLGVLGGSFVVAAAVAAPG